MYSAESIGRSSFSSVGFSSWCWNRWNGYTDRDRLQRCRSEHTEQGSKETWLWKVCKEIHPIDNSGPCHRKRNPSTPIVENQSFLGRQHALLARLGSISPLD